MLNERTKIELLILKNPEARYLLKEMILEKEDRYLEVKNLRSVYLKSDEFPNLSEEFRPHFLEQVFDHVREGRETKIIERDLSNMCYAIVKREPKLGFGISRKWERAYHFATKEVRIEDTVSRLLGVDLLNRNISCPFHQDKKPSLKVYSKSNRWVCFGCGLKGSPIDFVMNYQSCSFKEAVIFLANNFS